MGYSLYTTEDLMLLFKAKHERSSITANTLANEMAMQQIRRAYPHPIRTMQGSKRLWVVRQDPRFSKFTPTMFGTLYDAERGREEKKRGGK